MANIQPYIDQILNAVYGEEVRSSMSMHLKKEMMIITLTADLKKK